jgi:hypothetical protein
MVEAHPDLSEDVQAAKLALITEVAGRVWDD